MKFLSIFAMGFASLVISSPASAQLKDALKRELQLPDAVQDKLEEAAAEDDAHNRFMTMKGCVTSQKFYRRGAPGVFYISFQSDEGLMQLQYGRYDSTSSGTERGPHLWVLQDGLPTTDYANPESVAQLQPILDAIIVGAAHNRPFELMYRNRSTVSYSTVQSVKILWNETC